MEELGLDYDIKKYVRKNALAPEELKKISPTGVAPVLQVFKPGQDEPLVLAESGHIVLHLLRHYDPSNKLGSQNAEEEELIDYYLHFAEGSLQPPLVSMLVNKMTVQYTPWPLQFFSKKITDKMNDLYYLKRLHANLRLLDDRLAAKNGGYMVGDRLTAADIILDFPVNECLFENESRAGIDLVLMYPNLYKWHQLTSKEPLRIAAAEKAKF